MKDTQLNMLAANIAPLDMHAGGWHMPIAGRFCKQAQIELAPAASHQNLRIQSLLLSDVLLPSFLPVDAMAACAAETCNASRPRLQAPGAAAAVKAHRPNISS
jgi:hypothetical protein